MTRDPFEIFDFANGLGHYNERHISTRVSMTRDPIVILSASEESYALTFKILRLRYATFRMTACINAIKRRSCCDLKRSMICGAGATRNWMLEMER